MLLYIGLPGHKARRLLYLHKHQTRYTTPMCSGIAIKPLYKMGHSEVLFLYNIERHTSGWNLVSRFILYLHGRSLCTVIPEWNMMSY